MTYTLETRKCSNPGCTATFRVLPASKQAVCSIQCTENGEPHGRTLAAKRARRNALRAEAKEIPVVSLKELEEL